ncbi:hypothetical protein DFJ73DRAFT_227616 [Zopfochytrium polystomum]|nr:hypothetical protein DFJ73DRAFT_227616 [Zopfochytrium polystomum]
MLQSNLTQPPPPQRPRRPAAARQAVQRSTVHIKHFDYSCAAYSKFRKMHPGESTILFCCNPPTAHRAPFNFAGITMHPLWSPPQHPHHSSTTSGLALERPLMHPSTFPCFCPSLFGSSAGFECSLGSSSSLLYVRSSPQHSTVGFQRRAMDEVSPWVLERETRLEYAMAACFLFLRG